MHCVQVGPQRANLAGLVVDDLAVVSAFVVIVAVRRCEGTEFAVVGDGIGDGESQSGCGLERCLDLYAKLDHLQHDGSGEGGDDGGGADLGTADRLQSWNKLAFDESALQIVQGVGAGLDPDVVQRGHVQVEEHGHHSLHVLRVWVSEDLALVLTGNENRVDLIHQDRLVLPLAVVQ